MTDVLVKAFDSLLGRTVVNSRLSGSKVKELQELAIKAVAHDHELVTSLLKLNTSLPPASTARISSLYVFDAIARAAKAKAAGTQVSTERGRGTPAGLLAKMEAVVGEWIQGMVDDGKGGVWSDGRDKTRKVVEIWRKGSTFPDSCVNQLAARIAAASTPGSRSPLGPVAQKPARSTTPVEPPPFHLIERSARTMGGTPNSHSPAPQQQHGQLPPEIMAMLGVKEKEPEPVAAPVPQSNAALDAVLANVRKPATPNLDTASLAALANLGATLGQKPPSSQSASAQPLPPRPNDDRNGHPSRDGSRDGRERRRSRSPDRYRDRAGDWHDHRDAQRGSWDRDGDRDPRGRDPRDRDYQPRDRDPRGYRGDPRDRDRDHRDYGHERDYARDRDPREGRGRDPRERESSRDPRDSRDRPPSGEGRNTLPPKPDGLPPRPTPPSTNMPLPRRGSHSQTRERDEAPRSGPGFSGPNAATGRTLETFDWSSFNAGDGACWAALGEAWRASTGQEPNQMELMQFMVTQMSGMRGMGMGGGASGSEMGGMGGMGMGGFQ
ncbi:hypothetical protein CspeluHIS016_0103500 [Cutaneotrichosporon spelunceum]|uniref:CID domain-containing protein n=1 Tax=Cutaneotrichosporon spelunceum TaxID=1672016 RepID=A0AAD3TNL8_9TREE|nr:hypothetical protein CspeluHIS016_0103500 [Cutaneotrichosporon spelunceum]